MISKKHFYIAFKEGCNVISSRYKQVVFQISNLFNFRIGKHFIKESIIIRCISTKNFIKINVIHLIIRNDRSNNNNI